MWMYPWGAGWSAAGRRSCSEGPKYWLEEPAFAFGLTSQPAGVAGAWCSLQEISAWLMKEETPRLLLLRFLCGSEGQMTVPLVKPQTGQAVEQQGLMREEWRRGKKR